MYYPAMDAIQLPNTCIPLAEQNATILYYICNISVSTKSVDLLFRKYS